MTLIDFAQFPLEPQKPFYDFFHVCSRTLQHLWMDLTLPFLKWNHHLSLTLTKCLKLPKHNLKTVHHQDYHEVKLPGIDFVRKLLKYVDS